MAVVVPDEGQIRELGLVLAAANQKFILFKANITPDANTVFNDVAAVGAEADFPGYARVTPVWGAIAIDGNGKASSTATAATFTRSAGAGSQNVYGWAWIETSTNKVLCAERFTDAPKIFANPGDFRTVQPTHTLVRE